MFDHRDIDIGLFPGESDQALYQLTLAELEQVPDDGGQPQVVPDELEEMAPDIYLAAVLSALDRDRLTGYDLVRVAQARKRLVSSLEAEFYADIGEVAHSCDPDSVVREATVVEFASEELQPALCWTRRRADVELGFALDLRHRLARVAESLRSGAIDTQRARVISQETVGLDPDPRSTVVDRALEIAPGLTTGQLRARIKKMCIAIDPGSMERNFAAGIEERRLVVSPNPDLTAGIAIQQVDPGDAIDAEKYVHGIAMGLKRAGGEDRSLDQLKADVAIDLLRGRTPDSVSAPEKHVVVHVRAGSENPQPALEGDWEIPGFGPILDKVAQRMIDDADVVSRRLETADDDCQGHLSETESRRPNAGQARHVRAHYPICVFPGCRMPAEGCDIDHRHRYSRRGRTSCANLAPLCRRHHRCKDEGGWELVRSADGHHSWTSRLGHAYRVDRPP